MNRLSGKVIAIALALLFLLLASGASIALVLHGIQSVRSDENLSVSQEIDQVKAEREQKKADKAAEKASKKTTKKTTRAKPTASTTKKVSKAKPTASTTAKTKSSSKTTTKKKTTTTTKKKTEKPKKNDPFASSKIIYLTFDDGPYKYTDKLLEVLDKYDVKATFFVTNAYAGYRDIIGKEYRAGHTVAVHSYTHDYATVYANESAYWADFEKMNDIIEAQTGQRSTMFRFPGGSSNTVSKKYNTGIMSRLVKQAGEKGLSFYDWNVTSGDAGQTTSSEQVYKNIINGVQQQDRSIVLCHDVKSYTVNAMDKTIAWCLDHGYSFRVLTPNGFTVHHGTNN